MFELKYNYKTNKLLNKLTKSNLKKRYIIFLGIVNIVFFRYFAS